ncbi:MAG: transposase zinc-binding domain-containing protein [Myxococcales bacterium]|nr:transposase zinc-binding domain-containing protein [Myxococcales bacterium]
MAQYWRAFCAELALHDKHLPTFVHNEFEAYLKCGLLEYGYARCICEDCGQEHNVGYSCKRRGFCSPCAGRRMEETAKHLVESVLPEVPLRQWVMTLPWKLRTPLGYDREAMAVFVRSFAQALSRRYKHVAKRVRAPSENELLRIAAEVSGKVMVRCGL